MGAQGVCGAGGMTGAEHYKQAERCLESVQADGPHSLALLAEAQVHAALALAAATALRGDPEHGLTPQDYRAWHKVAGEPKAATA